MKYLTLILSIILFSCANTKETASNNEEITFKSIEKNNASSFENPTTKTIVTKAEFGINPGSEKVRYTADRDGILGVFEKLDAKIFTNACGPCIGQWDREGADKEEVNSIVHSFNRNFKKRASDWTDENEAQFAYEMKYYELYKAGKIKEAKALKNPQVKDTFTAIKPVVTGNRNHDGTYNKTVLDKYSLYPISFRMMVEMNAKNGMALYDKLHNEDIDYAIFKSGRKVGAYTEVSPYDKNGNFITEPFNEKDIINIPFYAMGLQTEVPSKDKNSITRGSQVTKIITMDRMDAGMPIDFMEDDPSFSKRYREWNVLDEAAKEEQSDLYKEIKNNNNKF